VSILHYRTRGIFSEIKNLPFKTETTIFSDCMINTSVRHILHN